MTLLISVQMAFVLPRFSTAEKVVDKQLCSRNFIEVKLLMTVMIILKQSGKLAITSTKVTWKMDMKS